MSMSIYNLDNLYVLAENIKKSGVDTSNIIVTINVGTKEVLNKLNEEFFYKNAEDKENFELEVVDEINVIISGIKFKYIYG